MYAQHATMCALCGSDHCEVYLRVKDTDHLTDTRYGIARCVRCGLVFVHPQPSDEEMARLYFEGYYGEGRGRSFLSRFFSRVESLLYRERVWKIARLRKEGRILDVGCGDGKFLEAMKHRGWVGYGVETSRVGAEVARFKRGLEVFNGELVARKFESGFFDVVTLWQVLEHVRDPLRILREVGRILKEDGLLYVSAPNIESFQAKFGGCRWFHFDVPRHLYHYSPRTLKGMLEQSGFKVIGIDHWSWEYNPVGLLQSTMNRLGGERNFLYNTVKRGIDYRSKIGWGRYFGHLMFTGLVALLLGVPTVTFSYVISSVGFGGIVEVYCRKSRAKGKTGQGPTSNGFLASNIDKTLYGGTS